MDKILKISTGPVHVVQMTAEHLRSYFSFRHFSTYLSLEAAFIIQGMPLHIFFIFQSLQRSVDLKHLLAPSKAIETLAALFLRSIGYCCNTLIYRLL